MIKIKKKIFFIVKSTFVLAMFLTLGLFFYAAFFFEPSPKKIESTENKITKEEEKLKEKEEEEKQKLKEPQIAKKISDTTKNKTKIKQVKTTLKDGLYAVLEDKAITKSDIIKAGLNLNVDYGLTHSCYDPEQNGYSCGHCDACQLRIRGFKKIGLSDPLKYSK